MACGHAGHKLGRVLMRGSVLLLSLWIRGWREPNTRQNEVLMCNCRTLDSEYVPPACLVMVSEAQCVSVLLNQPDSLHHHPGLTSVVLSVRWLLVSTWSRVRSCKKPFFPSSSVVYLASVSFFICQSDLRCHTCLSSHVTRKASILGPNQGFSPHTLEYVCPQKGF